MKKYDGYALITGGSSGIGLAFAKKLASWGYGLVIVSNDEMQLKEVETSLKNNFGVDVISISVDLADPESTDFIFNQIQARNISVGLLVNNAGLGTSGLFHNNERQKISEIIKVMCLSMTDLTYRFLPPMLEKKSGGIIIMSSIASCPPTPALSVYGAVKGFSLNLGVNLHSEYSTKGIDFITVCPAFVDTNIFKSSGIIAPPVPLMTPDYIAQKTLSALGKVIVLILTGKQIKMRVGLLLAKILPRPLMEKIAQSEIKKIFKSIGQEIDL